MHTAIMLTWIARVRYIKILTWLQGFLIFWSFFYIWFGFVCAQVSSGNCKTMDHEKFATLTLKPRSRVRILIYWTWAITTGYSRQKLEGFSCLYSRQVLKGKILQGFVWKTTQPWLGVTSYFSWCVRILQSFDGCCNCYFLRYTAENLQVTWF